MISQAFAASSAAATTTAVGGGLDIMTFAPMGVVLLIMYFLIMRPQQEQMKKHQAMLSAIQKDDEVVLNSGVLGRVRNIEDEKTLSVEVADGVQVKVLRSYIRRIVKPEPEAAEKSDKPVKAIKQPKKAA